MDVTTLLREGAAGGRWQESRYEVVQGEMGVVLRAKIMLYNSNARPLLPGHIATFLDVGQAAAQGLVTHLLRVAPLLRYCRRKFPASWPQVPPWPKQH